MMSQKGGGTLPTQIKRLEHELDEKQIKQSKMWAQDDPLMVRLAFKYLDKPHRKEGLSKSQAVTYEQIRKISEDNADKWKTARLAEKK